MAGNFFYESALTSLRIFLRKLRADSLWKPQLPISGVNGYRMFA